MDGQQFDTIVRRFARSTSRRTVVKGLLAGAIGSLVTTRSALAAVGDTCSTDQQCGPLPCVDGVCCSTACDGLCQICDRADSLGTCTFVAAGQDPNNECPGSNFCSGAGSCSCSTQQSPCGGDNECCGGNCIGDICCDPVGSTCGQDNNCCSGFCEQGICCSSRCAGTCNQCNVAGLEGICTDNNANCEDDNLCTTDTCTAGACSFPVVADGTALPGGSVCCDGTPCQRVDSCTAAQCAGGICRTESACEGGSAYCVNGSCVECLTISDCEPDQDPCTDTTCTNNTCGNTPKDCSASDGLCTTGICDAAGECQSAADPPGTVCDPEITCQTGTCNSDSQCIGMPVDCSHLDEACKGGVCDSRTGECGAVNHDDGFVCAANKVCADGECVCDEGFVLCNSVCVAGECCQDADCVESVTPAFDAVCATPICVENQCTLGPVEQACGDCQTCHLDSLTCIDLCSDGKCCCDDGETCDFSCCEDDSCTSDHDCEKGQHCCDGECQADVCVTPACKHDTDCEIDACCCKNGSCSSGCCAKPPEKDAGEPATTLPDTGSGNTADRSAIAGMALAGGLLAWAGARMRKPAHEESPD